jgi:hypothetical protein
MYRTMYMLWVSGVYMKQGSKLRKLWGKVLLEAQFLQAMYFTAEGIYCNSDCPPHPTHSSVFMPHYLLKGEITVNLTNLFCCLEVQPDWDESRLGAL